MSTWIWEATLVLCLALLIDIVLGEPPLRLHPTVWMGRLIEVGYRIGSKLRPSMQKAYGVVLAIGVIWVFAGGSYVILQLLNSIPNEPIRIIITAILLKSTFSVRMMREYASD